jgi:hypothetical protein
VGWLGGAARTGSGPVTAGMTEHRHAVESRDAGLTRTWPYDIHQHLWEPESNSTAMRRVWLVLCWAG